MSSTRWITLTEAEALIGGGVETRRGSLLAALRAEDVKSRERFENGEVQILSDRDWAELKAGSSVRDRAEVDWQRSLLERFDFSPTQFRRVEVDRETLNAFFRLTDRATPAGGRPRTWNWEDAAIQVMARLHFEGCPEKQADVENLMAQWFRDHCNSEPAESEIRKHASKIHKSLRDAEQL